MSVMTNRINNIPANSHLPEEYKHAWYLLSTAEMDEKKVVIASGYANPVHGGHIDYIREARLLGDLLVFIVNSDLQVKIKGSQEFMDERERLKIVEAIRWVDLAVISIDEDGSVCQTINELVNYMPCCPKVFAKGGDRVFENIPERAVCKELGIKMKFGVGGEKTQSSSALLAKLKRGGK
jgi:cytidyltransferase-like protein